MRDLASFHGVVRGRVQGVYFRAFVFEKAGELGLTGYVRNIERGGEVEVYVEGEKVQLEQLIKHLRRGPPAAMVKDVITEWSNYSGRYTTFSVLY